MAGYSESACPICKLDSDDVSVTDYGERIALDCKRCGTFSITRTAASSARSMQLGPKLSAWIRERTESGAVVPEINTNTLNDVKASLPNYRVSEKLLLLLRAFERKSQTPGQWIDVVPELDYPLAWASGEGEFDYLIEALAERGLLRGAAGEPFKNKDYAYQVEITPAGWTFLEDHERPGVISDQVFVAMSFSDELMSAWKDGIEIALSKAGFRPYRVDAVPHIDRIDMKIISEIKNSRFLVADVTQQRPGVYFEAGYAMGIGLPVFWSVREDDLPNVHFDTRQYNHIVWKNELDLAEKLYLFVTAIVGKGTSG